VGNSAAWLYLAVMYSRGEKIKPNGAWINDLLRQETNEPYQPGESRLPRGSLKVQDRNGLLRVEPCRTNGLHYCFCISLCVY